MWKKISAFIGIALLVSASISGCADNGGINNSEKSAARSASAEVPKECSDPLGKAIKSGEKEINARAAAFCMSEALGKLKGWAQETRDTGGKVVSTALVNVRPLATHITANSPKTGEPIQIVLVEGTTFIKEKAGWVEANALAKDSDMVAFAALPRSFEVLLNAELRAAGVDSTLKYKLIGKEDISGNTVYALELELPAAKSGESSRVVRRSRLYMRSDYVVLRTENYIDNKLVNATLLTEVDKEQKIINPRYGKDIHEPVK